jgi:flavin-dependent dehydrogenase
VREPEEGKLIGTAAENLVIGGGLAGGMVGLRLAATGKQVLLLEKEGCAHHKVCGEFLSAEAVAYLRQAGVDPVSLGAVPIEAVRLSARDRAVERRLPFRALSLSRDVLDAALLGRAEEEGCMVRRGTAAVGLSRMGENWTAELADGTAVHARRVFLATGKHDLRGWSRPPGVQGDLVGFKLHWSLSGAEEMALRGRMELFLFSGGYGGLALVENHTANLCLVVGRAQLRKLGGWEEVLESLLGANAHIRRFLEGAQPLWQRPLAISSIPYGYMSRRSGGPWCVGDQAAVIPSFTGDGMAIALHSGALAVEMSLAGETADEYHRVLEGQLKKGMWVATALSRAMVSSAGRKMAPLALALLPGAIGWIAKSTRIPDTAMNLLCDAKSRFS